MTVNLDSQDYLNQKAILFNAINKTQLNEHLGKSYYAPASSIPYFDRVFGIDRNVFKKTDAEKSLLLTLKAQTPKSRNHKFKLLNHSTF